LKKSSVFATGKSRGGKARGEKLAKNQGMSQTIEKLEIKKNRPQHGVTKEKKRGKGKGFDEQKKSLPYGKKKEKRTTTKENPKEKKFN